MLVEHRADLVRIHVDQRRPACVAADEVGDHVDPAQGVLGRHDHRACRRRIHEVALNGHELPVREPELRDQGIEPVAVRAVDGNPGADPRRTAGWLPAPRIPSLR